MAQKIIRSGIIPFSFYRNDIWVLLSEDSKYGEKGDFGGGRKRTETPYQAAQREAREESSGLLCIGPEDSQPKFSISYRTAMIYFVPYTFDTLVRTRDTFNKSSGNKEVKSLHIMLLKDILNDESNSNNVWPFIKRLLRENRGILNRERFVSTFSE